MRMCNVACDRDFSMPSLVRTERSRITALMLMIDMKSVSLFRQVRLTWTLLEPPGVARAVHQGSATSAFSHLSCGTLVVSW